jgi:hypothetical protein
MCFWSQAYILKAEVQFLEIVFRTERTMEIHHPDASMFEPATYMICILGMLDKNWSDYCGGMNIEHDIVLDQYPVTILTGELVDQAALIGVINTLYDLGCPLLMVECVEARSLHSV